MWWEVIRCDVKMEETFSLGKEFGSIAELKQSIIEYNSRCYTNFVISSSNFPDIIVHIPDITVLTRVWHENWKSKPEFFRDTKWKFNLSAHIIALGQKACERPRGSQMCLKIPKTLKLPNLEITWPTNDSLSGYRSSVIISSAITLAKEVHR